MDILTVNGTVVPSPAELTVGRFDLSSENSGRTMDGKMVKDIISKKSRLSLKWNTLSWESTKLLLDTIEAKVTFSVRYPDPKEGRFVTKTMYVGDRTVPSVMVKNGRLYWGNISMEFIEV